MAPEAPAVNIIPSMAAVAVIRRLFVLSQISPVAGVAEDFIVSAFQGEIGLGIVIEGPQQPGIRIVAIAAVFTHPAFVDIFRTVAGETGDIGLLILRVQMTGFTGCDAMNADQGKTGDIVFEKDLLVPAVFVMAIAAVLALLAFMDIDRAMTGKALGVLEVIHCHSAMAGMAYQIPVLALQCKLGVLLMIEFHLFPILGTVTLLAFLTVSAFVFIVLLVA